MYKELGSIRGVVDLSAQEALDRAEAFLTQQGYTTMRRAGNSLTVLRHPPGQTGGQKNTLNLTVTASPQPGGGVRIRVRGNDQKGVQERQDAWIEWSKSLPKKPEASDNGSSDQQEDTTETPEVPLVPPPTVEKPHPWAPSSPSQPVSSPPRRESKVQRWFASALGGVTVKREAVFTIATAVGLGLLIAIPLYLLGWLTPTGSLSLTVSKQPTAQDVLQAFRDQGLEVGSTSNLDDDPTWQSGPVPKTYKEALRFSMPSLGRDSLGNDKGGKVLIFDSPKDLKPVRDYYEGFSGMLASHVYVNNAETVLVQMSADDVRKDKADRYGDVLKNEF